MRNDQRLMTCVVVDAPVREEMRVLLDDEVHLTELHRKASAGSPSTTGSEERT